MSLLFSKPHRRHWVTNAAAVTGETNWWENSLKPSSFLLLSQKTNKSNFKLNFRSPVWSSACDISCSVGTIPSSRVTVSFSYLPVAAAWELRALFIQTLLKRNRVIVPLKFKAKISGYSFFVFLGCAARKISKCMLTKFGTVQQSCKNQRKNIFVASVVLLTCYETSTLIRANSSLMALNQEQSILGVGDSPSQGLHEPRLLTQDKIQTKYSLTCFVREVLALRCLNSKKTCFIFNDKNKVNLQGNKIYRSRTKRLVNSCQHTYDRPPWMTDG